MAQLTLISRLCADKNSLFSCGYQRQQRHLRAILSLSDGLKSVAQAAIVIIFAIAGGAPGWPILK
jgi:hypothetical protein